ncbi:LCP family protein [Amycolatopsis tolypomycina]|uniref:Cell envelope-related function transcriptional attenuator common domain-containing protein n=1 Tax=Amycolatopsis tolypomycina TaxID=208445 RepID=A0A1H4IHW8_9PSEU|nr:LCP family protein [Amycolatopsis tolypomycina]SEB33455.1 cell envelope-related function transcriptional attenuator common domain-containing protein [Amycolatopsis tolypomycina]
MTEQAAPTIPARRVHGAAVFARRGGKVVVSLLSVAILALTWYGWHFIGDPNTGLTTTNVFADTEAHAKPLDGAVDILLVGQDSRTDAQGNPLPREVLDMLHAGVSDGELNTDTMILVHIPQNGKQAIAISFPRDSWVELTGGFGKHKLNSAFVYAYTDTYRTLQRQGMTDLKKADQEAKVAGRKNLIATIEKFIGKPGMIDRYAEVNLASFYEITKSIGGVEVCLKGPVKEAKSGVDLPGGQQTIEGVQALAFVRQRYGLPNYDLDRIARQQAFLSGLARKVISTDVLTSPVKIADLVAAVKKSVVLSQGWDLTEFAEQMRGLTGGNIEFHTIPTLGNANIGGADVLRVDPAQVAAEVARLTSDGETPAAPTSAQLPGAKAVTVELYDGSGSPALAGQLHAMLQGKGFTLAADQKLSTRNTTVVRYNPADDAAPALVKQALGIGAQAEPDRDVPAGHVRVLLGKDLRNSAAGAGGAPTSSPAKPAATSAPATPAAPPINAGGVPCVN